ncbi:pitrilysin family protein [Spirulina sp. CCNP1310]|uniref:M16 family metallopeptidase n=1 Tax=Spirulina sp. CCNP1310 TaxID=3110249 RepID=UPI002B3B5CCF|nr:pitrilysin family protein [Spirulina sp. CCNP1310]
MMNRSQTPHFRFSRPLPWLRAMILLVGSLLFVLLAAPMVSAATARHYTELEFPPLRAVEMPNYERYTLPNGIVVYLMENHELPLVSGQASFRTGGRLEPAAQVGLASLTGTVLRSGGTVERTPDEINQFLEQRAASVETDIGDAAGSASFESLTDDLPDVLNLFAEVLQKPAFRVDQLDLAKQQLGGAIARRNDDPDDIASREFSKRIYGPEHPYARSVEYKTLANIDREDLIQFYQQSFRPEQMLLGIVGDFEPRQMKALLAEAFGDWQQAAAPPLPALPTVEPATLGGTFFIEQPQLTQSYIYLGHLGGQLSDPDYAALSLMNGVLNGFGGRFFNELRSRQGLAYSVYGYWSPRFDYPGLFIAGGQTRSEATVPFIESLRREIDRIRTNPITPAELDYAKESILNSFVFNFQSPGQTLSRLMRYEYYGYPADFIFSYQREIQNTTAADILQAAAKYLKPEQLTTLVVGNSGAIDPPLANLGSEVAALDISIPPAQ